MITWEPEVLARIRHLALRAHQAVEGTMQGAHRSRALGPSMEFVDYKEYSPGDSLRDLDWRVLARSDRRVVRRHRAESFLPSVLVLDASADMGTGSAGLGGPGDRAGVRPPLDGTKFGYAICLAATLAWYLYLHAEPVGLAIMGGSQVPWDYLPPRSGRAHLSAILAALASTRPSGVAHIGETLSRLAPRLRRSSMVILLSDLMEEVEAWKPALRALGQRRTDLRLVHLYDPDELDLERIDLGLFFSPEGGDSLAIDPVGARPVFREVVESWRDEVRSAALSQRAFFLPAPTDRPLGEPLWRIVAGAAGRGAP